MATQVGFQLESSLASKHLTDAEYIKGGYIVVKTLAERNALPVYTENDGTVTQDGIIVVGSLVYVSEEQKSYRYNGIAWVEEAGSSEGTVTSITAGTGLTGGTIVTSGTIAVDTSVIQSKLDTAQMSAVNSGITSTKVTAYDNYATTKQNNLTEGSGIDITNDTISIDSDVVALKEDLPEGEINLTLTETSISDGTTTLSLKITAEDRTIDW